MRQILGVVGDQIQTKKVNIALMFNHSLHIRDGFEL